MALRIFGRDKAREAGARAALDALGAVQPTVDVDAAGVVLAASPAFLSLTGYDLADIAGRPLSSLNAAGTPEGNAGSRRRRWARRDGSDLWVDVQPLAIPGTEGRSMLIVRDITADVMLVAEAESRIGALSRTQLFAEFTIDGRFILANPNFLKAIGRTFAELEGRPHASVVWEEQARHADYTALWAALARGEPQDCEVRLIHKSGAQVWTQGYFTPVRDASGRLYKVILLSNDVTRRRFVIDTLTEHLQRMARHDLGARIDQAFMVEYESIRIAFNRTIDHLSALIGGLKDLSGSIKTATGEILAGTNDLSDRTTRQAATIEETAAAMEQLARVVTANVGRADEAAAKSQAVWRSAEEGGEVMRAATEAMGRITTSSGKISNIIGLIDDIAFQTNLLALNASVEAARAGDAGRGFAVVAVEVRRLAQSAATASGEVKALVEMSSRDVESGSRLVDSAADKLAQMLAAIHENSGIIDSIARDSREQALSIEEVGRAVRLMDEMTQHNVALVEETSAALEGTEARAADLDRIVEAYSVAGEDRSRNAA